MTAQSNLWDAARRECSEAETAARDRYAGTKYRAYRETLMADPDPRRAMSRYNAATAAARAARDTAFAAADERLTATLGALPPEPALCDEDGGGEAA